MADIPATHPWIDFRLDLEPLSFISWMLLGEAQSKCEHIAHTPLVKETAERLHRMYLSKGIAATTAIEGNTLTEEEVRRYLDGELKLPPSRQYLGNELDNIYNACNTIVENLFASPHRIRPITVEDLQDYNHQVLKNLPVDEGVMPGRFRLDVRGVWDYRGVPPEDCPRLTRRLVEWLNTDFQPPTPEMTVAFAILKAIIAHLYLVWIHPFADGNGRTARLLEVRILLENGVSTPAAHLLSNHYNQTRTQYYQKLRQASQDRKRGIYEFIDYALQGLVDGLRQQLEEIQEQQAQIVWRDLIYYLFRQRKGEPARRQRQFILELSNSIPPNEPIRTLEVFDKAPKALLLYKERTERTMHRDLKELEQLGLIVLNDKHMIINREPLIRRFLPFRVRSQNRHPNS